MKTWIYGLAGVVAVASASTGAGTPTQRAAVALDGVDPAVNCISDNACETALELVRRPRPGSRAAARIVSMSAGNEGLRYAGDRPLLTTISPNGDGVRDRAAIRFRLTGDATVDFVVARTATRARVIHARTRKLRAGRHTFYWSPSADLPTRTYLVYFRVRDRMGRTMYGTRNGDPSRRQRTPVVRVLGVDAAFQRESYIPGAEARLRVSADTERLTLQVYRSGPERVVTRRDDELNGVPVGDPVTYGWTRRRDGAQTLRLRIGDWPTGVYFARLITEDDRVGFAPFVVRPKRLGLHRAAVVLPTYTWQAYNLRDGNGDGWGDTWYVHQAQRSVRLGRPQLNRGVPMAFRVYDLPFLRWLASNDRPVDYLAQSDLAGSNGDALRSAYALLIFPGHHEYVTRREYDAVTGFRNRGGNLMFLSANNFFWRVDRRGNRIRRVALWRKLGRPEASLVGIQYAGNGPQRGPYTVRDTRSAPWLFAGTGYSEGSKFGRFGIEIDMRASSSPHGTRVLAEIPNLLRRGLSAQMTYYDTAAGAKVFAAGAFTLAGVATRPYGEKLLDNLWRQLTAERSSR